MLLRKNHSAIWPSQRIGPEKFISISRPLAISKQGSHDAPR